MSNVSAQAIVYLFLSMSWTIIVKWVNQASWVNEFPMVFVEKWTEIYGNWSISILCRIEYNRSHAIVEGTKNSIWGIIRNSKFLSVPANTKVSFWCTIWKLPPSYICPVERPVRCEVLVPGQCHYFCLGNIPAYVASFNYRVP